MKFSPNAEAALRKPDTQAKMIEMTPERQEKFKELSDGIIDYLRARTDGPIEAYMILRFVMEGFEEAFGIRGSIVVEKDDASV